VHHYWRQAAHLQSPTLCQTHNLFQNLQVQVHMHTASDVFRLSAFLLLLMVRGLVLLPLLLRVPSFSPKPTPGPTNGFPPMIKAPCRGCQLKSSTCAGR
jgi:hypothetical protein